MKAIVAKKYYKINDGKSFELVNLNDEKVTANQILVKVMGLSVNPVDTKMRQALTEGENNEGLVFGWDVYGSIEKIGKNVKNFKQGDKVFYSGNVLASGANREFHLIDYRLVAKAPNIKNVDEIAAYPLVSITAYEALYEKLGISKNQKDNQGKYLLIIGGAGGVGSISIQLAKLAGLKVIATASRPDSQKWCREMGADLVINHYEDMRKQIEAKKIKYVDYILCLNSTAEHYSKMIDLAKPFGKICTIVETDTLLNVSELQYKSLTLAYEFMSCRPEFQTDDMVIHSEILKYIAKCLETKKIKSIVTKKFNAINKENIRAAHELLESNKMIGKVAIYGEWKE